MENVIIAIDRKADTVTIENDCKLSTFITIGLVEGNDFYLKLEFENLEKDDFITLTKLFKAKKALKIESEIIKKEQFNISHIVVEKFNSVGFTNVTYECYSDDPDYSLIL